MITSNQEVTDHKLSERISSYRYNKGSRRSYLVKTKGSGRGSLLIDAGCPLPWPGLERGKIQLDYLLLTHCHFDHIVYVNKIKELTGCDLVSSDLCAQHLQKMDQVVLKEQFKHLLGEEYQLIEPLQVDQQVGEGDQLGPLRVIETPGHSDGGL